MREPAVSRFDGFSDRMAADGKAAPHFRRLVSKSLAKGCSLVSQCLTSTSEVCNIRTES